MDVVVHPLTHEVLVLTTLNIHNSRPFSLYPSIISFRSYQLSPSKQGMCDPWAHLTCTVEVASGFQVCNQYYIYKNKINTLIGLGLRTRVGKSDPFSIHLYIKKKTHFQILKCMSLVNPLKKKEHRRHKKPYRTFHILPSESSSNLFGESLGKRGTFLTKCAKLA